MDALRRCLSRIVTLLKEWCAERERQFAKYWDIQDKRGI